MIEIKKYGVSEKVAVLSISVMMYTISMIPPALGEISRAFPQVSPEIIKTISTLPSLVMVFASLLAGQLARFMTSKKILYIAMGLLFTGGILPLFIGGITFVLVTRVIFGFGYGMVFPLASSVVSELFEGQERASIMGIKGSVGAIAGIVFQLLGGFLAVYHWRYAFLGTILVIPIAIIIYLKLPEVDVKNDVEKGENYGKKLTLKTYGICLFNVVFNILMISFMTNVAIVMAVEGIGNAAQAGIVLTMFTAGAAITGFLYGKIANLLKKYTLSLAIGLLACAFFILLKVTTFNGFITGAIIFGLGFGIYNPNMTLAVISSAHKTAHTLAVSLYVSVQGVGQFSSPYVLSFLTDVFGLDGQKSPWIIVAHTFAIICVISVGVFTLIKPKGAETIS